ncbi:hypothetical protein LAZ67_11002707 [Cordylochernes scorpioides]|uniref:Uncharacterized protein n=1 Tax=Cordylochernes scorpioides TaxID=51811 RepID=A0ABY6L2W3_9ARAC|nr:hypothetical protein LAZ67_11002707 [Cordylochernes scorpioides]
MEKGYDILETRRTGMFGHVAHARGRLGMEFMDNFWGEIYDKDSHRKEALRDKCCQPPTYGLRRNRQEEFYDPIWKFPFLSPMEAKEGRIGRRDGAVCESLQYTSCACLVKMDKHEYCEVIKFFDFYGLTPKEIHPKLTKVHRNSASSISTVKSEQLYLNKVACRSKMTQMKDVQN